MNTITVSTKLSVRVCPSCGGQFAISQEYIDHCYELGGFRKTWACPYCKEIRGFGEGAQQKLEKQLQEAKRETEQVKTSRDWHAKRREEAMAEAEHFRKSRDGMKGALVKTKKRIAGGVCPCCNRSFVSLARHMKSQHPEYHQS